MSDFPQKPFTAKKSDRFLHQKRQKNKGKPTQKRPVSASKMPDSFLGVPCRKVIFRVPSKEERTARRLEFEQEKRAEFIKFLAKTQRPALLAAGITKKQIAGMENGFTPHGFNTHHKLPIYGGGTNDFSNLVLIRVFVPSPQYKFLEKWAKKGRKTYGKNKNTSFAEVSDEINRRALLAAAGKGR